MHINCRGCNKEPLDEDSVSPLLLSVKSGKVEAVLALISAGCDVNTKDMDGKSVVFWAAQEGCFEVLEVRVLKLDYNQLKSTFKTTTMNTKYHHYIRYFHLMKLVSSLEL